jgi:DNA-binding GntR family transcriptional regulator
MVGPKLRRREREALREKVYVQLRRQVMLGEFETGQRLAEEQVAEQLSVSRTPVREAFVRLHADRLLSRYEDGGYYVAEIDLLDLRDLYELRLTLELRGVQRASTDGVEHDRVALAALRDEWLAIGARPPEPAGSFIELDEAFHVALLTSSGNYALTDTLVAVNARIRSVRIYDFLTTDRILTSIEEHLSIVGALLDGDVDLATGRLREHIGASLNIVEQRAMDAMRERALRSRQRTAASAR